MYERMWSFMTSAEPSVFVDSNDEGIKRVRNSNGRSLTGQPFVITAQSIDPIIGLSRNALIYQCLFVDE